MSDLTGLCRPWAPPFVPTLRIGTAAPYWFTTRARLKETHLWRDIQRQDPWAQEGKHGSSLHLLPLFPGNAYLCSLLPFFYPPSASSSTHISKQFKHASHILQLLLTPWDSQTVAWASNAETLESNKREWWWHCSSHIPAWAQSSRVSSAWLLERFRPF